MAADEHVEAGGGGAEDRTVREARDFLNRVSELESSWRQRFLDDIKFRHGDSDNNWQWPNNWRERDSKPRLTINIIRQHNLQISNEAKQNKSSVAVRATGGGATKEAADVVAAVMRRIEYQSDAQGAYDTAREFQVDGGVGAFRIITNYAGPDTFNQEIFIVRIPDPLVVFDDPDAKKKDKSDRKKLILFDVIPNKDFEEEYPQWKGAMGTNALGTTTVSDTRVPPNHTVVAEYFRVVERDDELVEFWYEEGGRLVTARKSLMPPRVWAAIKSGPRTRRRAVKVPQVEWKLIVGEKVVDETIWPGKFIPVITIVGEETLIEGQIDRKGHTRALKDAQRMYNYNASSQVEMVAAQGKTPWIISAKAIEEYEHLWNTANLVNHSALVWNDVDDDGNKVQKPERSPPPVPSQAYQAGMDTAFSQLMMASGQWQNQMGMMGNERTGKAIERRQHQSDTAVFHFQDNYELGLRFCAKQLLDLIPKVYDWKQVVLLTTEGGEDFEVEIDPTARQAYAQWENHEGKVVRRVLNPQLGRYEVEADIGPAFGTRREETVEALTLILTQAPGLTGIIGDLLLGAMNFKEAQEAALRLKRMVPPQALGRGPSQQEQVLQQQVQSLQAALAKALQHNAKDVLKLAGKDQMRNIDVYKAETDRFKALQDAAAIDPEGLKAVIHALVGEALQTNLTPILSANQKAIDADSTTSLQLPPASPPQAGGGARQAPDGQWYILDPTRKGKYLRIAPLAQERRTPGMVGNA